MKVLIATKNPGKVQGAKQAFEEYFEDFEIESVSVPSDVPEQPVDKEIYQGAKNRVDNLIEYAKENNIEADYFLGIEAGVTNLLGRWLNVNMAVIKDKDGYESWGISSSFPIPDKYINKIIDNGLGLVMDEMFEGTNLSKGKGGISFLTKDVINRIDITKEAFVMALIQHTNELWNDK